MKSLFKTVSIIMIFSIFTRAAGFLFRIYLSRTLGAETLGIYQVAFSFFMVLCTIIASGLPLVISRLTAKYRATKDITSERKMLSCSLIISVVAAVVLSLFMLALSGVLEKVFADVRSVKVLLVLLPALVFYAIYGTFRGSLWGQNRYLGVCGTELIEQITRILICVLMLECFFVTSDGAISTGVSLTLSCVISAFMIATIYFCKGGKLGKAKGHYKEIIKTATPITGVRIASSLIQPIIAIIIPLRLVFYGYTSAQAMSQYGIAMGMTMPLLFIPGTVIGALSMALVPDLSTAITKNDENHVVNRISSSVIFSIFISCLLVPLYIGAGEQIGIFFFNNAQSGILLASSAWIMIPLGLVNITSSLLNAIGLEMKSLKNYVLGAILMLLCLWFLPKYVGIKAIVYGMGVCTTLASILNIRMLQKTHIKGFKLMKPLIKMVVFMIPSMAVTSFLCSILSTFIPLFFVLAISCSVGALFFVMLCIIFNVINISTFTVKFKQKFKCIKNKKANQKC